MSMRLGLFQGEAAGKALSRIILSDRRESKGNELETSPSASPKSVNSLNELTRPRHLWDGGGVAGGGSRISRPWRDPASLDIAIEGGGETRSEAEGFAMGIKIFSKTKAFVHRFH